MHLNIVIEVAKLYENSGDNTELTHSSTTKGKKKSILFDTHVSLIEFPSLMQYYRKALGKVF